MNSKQAKALRRALLPNPRAEVGVSRGTVFRGTTSYEQVQLNPHKPRGTLRLKAACPRSVYRKAKKNYERNRLSTA